MKTITVTVLAAVVVMCLPAICTAQYIYPQYPWNPVPVSPQAVYPGPAPGPGGGTMWYQLAPDPKVYQRWGRYTAELEYQRFQRSPHNSESDLDFMLRTFW